MSLAVTSALSHPVVSAQGEVDVVLRFSSATTETVRRPLNLSIVLDRSGSMGGTPLHAAIQAAKMVVDRLQPQDRLSVVTYDDEISTAVPSQLVTDPGSIKAALDRVTAGGLTNLCGGWLRGCDNVKNGRQPGTVDRVMLLTDGQANVGTTDTASITAKAVSIGEQGISTTTLGFGSYFNEDLLIAMAEGGRGNFYFIQSPELSKDVFYIEVEGLASLVADDLVVVLEPAAGVTVREVLNTYKTQKLSSGVSVDAGDVYGVEPRLVHLSLSLSGVPQGDAVPLLRVSYRYKAGDAGTVQSKSGSVGVHARVGTPEEAGLATPDMALLQETAKLRISRVKEEATALNDKGRTSEAVALLRGAIDRFRALGLHDSFEFAEELDLLEHYAVQLERGALTATARKELKDQAYQGRSRDRGDLKQRALSDGNTSALTAVTAAPGEEGDGVVLECVQDGGKLRIRVVSAGYDPSFNVQFPRAIRQAGARYLVERIEVAGNGGFYRAAGDIKLLLRPGESRPGTSSGRSSSYSSAPRKSTKQTLATLERTTDVGDGVLVQCVKDGSKLRARVVSDGYDPNKNMRFPREVREVGRLFVCDEVTPSSDGSYYVVNGRIRLLVQPGQTT